MHSPAPFCSSEGLQVLFGVSGSSAAHVIRALIFKAFLRSLSIHLQICWQVVPGKKYFWCSIIAGWGVPAIILGILIPVTGVSYRFGDTCHINHHKALQDYWGPLLAFATVSTVLQFITFGYCIRVYIRALLNDSTVNSQSQVSSGGLPSYSSRSGSIKTLTPGQAYRRVKKVIALQWRGTIIVLIIIIDVLFLAICFVQMDNTVSAAMRNFEKARPWLLCLALNQGNKDACLDQVREAKLVTKEATVIALLFLLSLNGIWCLLFLGRTSMVLGWYDLLRRPFQKEQPEFVSADARRFSAISGAPSSTRQYEMITSPSFRPPSMPSSLASVPLKAADTNVSTITTPPLYENGGLSPLPQSPRSPSSVYPDSDYFAKETSVRDSSNTFGQDAQYRSPKLSFSTPRPPSAGRSFSRDSSLSRPYSQTRETLPQRSFSPPQNPAGAGSRNLKPFSPPPIFASNSNRGESRGRSHSPIVEWDPTSTYAAGSGPRLGPGSEPGSGSGGVRPDGLGRIIDKDEGF